ncbi:hypothetical protein ACHQM5_007641 [Ranunculus cassubicifolius]
MTRSSRDIEARRLKNRLRQQRYRARKREEKSKQHESSPLLADLFVSGSPNVTNGPHLFKHDASDTKDRTVCEFGDIGKYYGACSPIKAEPFQVTCIAEEEHHTEFCGIDVAGDPYIYPEDDCPASSDKVEHCCVNNLEMECNPEKSYDRVMARRLKNRERQRRYRARRRLEADMKKATPQLTVESQLNGCPEYQVHCQRKWKDDARKAGATKEPQLTPTAIEHQTHTEPQLTVGRAPDTY